MREGNGGFLCRGQPPPSPSPLPQAPTPRRAAPPLLTTRAEALALYRAILRATAAFTWPDAHGRPWRDALRASTRREFDERRALADPEAVARALVVGRDALARAMEKLAAKAAGVDEERER